MAASCQHTDRRQIDLNEIEDLRLEIVALQDERDGLAAEVRDATAQLEKLQAAIEEAEEKLDAIRAMIEQMYFASQED